MLRGRGRLGRCLIKLREARSEKGGEGIRTSISEPFFDDIRLDSSCSVWMKWWGKVVHIECNKLLDSQLTAAKISLFISSLVEFER